MKTNKKQIVFAFGTLAVMLPVVAAGFICKFVFTYFMMGCAYCEISFEEIAKQLAK